MFCDKENVNILTRLLASHAIRDVVVCPGSRNGVIVHNLHESDAFRLHSVTDERSAGFVALGLSLATKAPVAVCVTSGSALLNLLPAVAEACYRQVPLIALSADRPADLIGQLDGQTIVQTGALLPYAQTFEIVEPHDESTRRMANRKVNEALLNARQGRCVHLNIPISEPLFSFRTPTLPDERTIFRLSTAETLQKIRRARLPLLVCGQMHGIPTELSARIERGNGILLLPELIANLAGSHRLSFVEQEGWPTAVEQPDLVIHAGGNLVGKRLKQYLRGLCDVEVIRVAADGELSDTFFHLQGICACETAQFFELLAEIEENSRVKEAKTAFSGRFVPETAEEKAVAALRDALTETTVGSLHLANSSAVRLASRIFPDCPCPIFCNRGTNGIEGSLSAAVGYARADISALAVCLIGDLSFFYDQNALWSASLPPNLRIVLLNNGGGRIFDRLPGLSDSPAKDLYIKAEHETSAHGICEAYGADYLAVKRIEHCTEAFRTLLAPERTRATLVEILIP